MTRQVRSRLGAALAAVALACVGAVAAAGPASAAACSGTTGVTVVIDTGSSVSTRCAGGSYSSAMSALRAVADVVFPVKFQGTVVCRIDGYPSTTDDPCFGMPPSSAYWAFFHAPRGGSWTYSSSGAASYDPPAGSVIGFAFGSGQAPRVAPPAATATSAPTRTTAAAKPTTKAPSTPTATSRTTTGSAGPRSATPSPAATSPSATTPGATTSGTASPTAGPSSSAVPEGGPSPSDGSATLAAEPTSTAGGAGGTGTLVAGGALLLLVGGGAAWVAWRRRT